jgi:hypothetical protein
MADSNTPPFTPPGPPPWLPPGQPLHVPASLLAQTQNDDVSANTVFSAQYNTEITSMVVSNHGVTATAYTLYHSTTSETSGTAVYSSVNKLAARINLPGNTSDLWESTQVGTGITLSKGHRLGMEIDQSSNITISVYGIIEQAR